MERTQQRIARWKDARGEHTVNGVATTLDGRFAIVSFGGYGVVAIPDGAEVFRPAIPTMERVGTVVRGRVS